MVPTPNLSNSAALIGGRGKVTHCIPYRGQHTHGGPTGVMPAVGDRLRRVLAGSPLTLYYLAKSAHQELPCTAGHYAAAAHATLLWNLPVPCCCWWAVTACPAKQEVSGADSRSQAMVHAADRHVLPGRAMGGVAKPEAAHGHACHLGMPGSPMQGEHARQGSPSGNPPQPMCRPELSPPPAHS